MQHLIIALAMFFSTLLFSQTKEKNVVEGGVSITVKVVNALNNKGTVYFALYTKDGFGKTPLVTNSSKIEEGQCTVVFNEVPRGVYAITCFHDENENKKMDFAENGMPLESYGSSNNVFNYGPPEFESSKFEVKNEDLSLEIKF